MQSTLTIVLATQNQHKIKEIKKILGSNIQYHSLGNYSAFEIKEPGKTLFENSLAKAVYTYKISGKPSLADDSGLFVDALNGEPGIFSSRYGRNDKERIARLLKELKNKKNRMASFRAVFVYYYAPNKYKSFKGICVGEIVQKPRGKAGFGYDPVFKPKGYSKTFAELGEKTKNQISHRARALAKFKRYLKNMGK